MPILSKFRAVKGMLPRQYEMTKWEPAKFLLIFALVNELMVSEAIKITTARWKEMEDKYLDGTHPFEEEMLHRIGYFTTDPDFKPRTCYFKFAALVRVIGKFLKTNPSYITLEMKSVIEKNPRLEWMNVHFKTIETRTGIEVTVPATIDDTTPEKREFTKKDTTPEVKIMETMTDLADIMSKMVKGIKSKDLNDMDAKQKIDSIVKILGAFNSVSKFKVNASLFKKLNTHSAGRDDLEKALLDMSEQ